MTTLQINPGLQWDMSTGIAPYGTSAELMPQGALMRDTLHNCDQVAVVYDKGQTPPEITIARVSGMVHTVLADGIAVAVIASSSGQVPTANDVLLVERLI